MIRSTLISPCRWTIAFAFALAALLAPQACADEITTYVSDGAAIGGTDPVSYFRQGEPLPGSDEFTTTWDGVTWKFSSAENRDAFVADPEKYAPAFGGYCATGASFGRKFPIDPVYWNIVDGTLYLNNSSSAQDVFLKDEPGTISRATAQWEKIRTIPANKL